MCMGFQPTLSVWMPAVNRLGEEGVWYGVTGSPIHLSDGRWKFIVTIATPDHGDYKFRIRVTPKDQISWTTPQELAKVSSFLDAWETFMRTM